MFHNFLYIFKDIICVYNMLCLFTIIILSYQTCMIFDKCIISMRHRLYLNSSCRNICLDKVFLVLLIRGLRMLSLVFGSEVTDASVAAIATSYPNLELLDLSGYVCFHSSFLQCPESAYALENGKNLKVCCNSIQYILYRSE